MKKPGRRRRLLLLFLYLAGLCGGIAVILLIPYFQHARDLQNLAREAAVSFQQEEGFGYGTNFGLSFLAYDREGRLLKEHHFGAPGEAFLLSTEGFLQASERGESLTRYGLVRAHNESSGRSRRTLCILCGVPLLGGGGAYSGCLILLRDMEGYLPLLIGFGLFWTGFALLFFFFMRLMERKEQQLEQLRRTYIAGMSHELKTPITSIKALAETLLYGYAEDEEKRLYYYDTILRQAGLLEETVLKILELSKLQSKASLFQRERVSAIEAFGGVLDRYSTWCEDAQTRLHLPDLSDIPDLYTSPALISRVLELLLHNSVRFVPEEGGEIRVEARVSGEKVLISVRDNGCGISREDLPHIFEQFYRSDRSGTGGSGLGLSIVKTILDGLGEEIKASSKPGETVFVFSVAREKRGKR